MDGCAGSSLNKAPIKGEAGGETQALFPGTRLCLLRGRGNTLQPAQMCHLALDDTSQGYSIKSLVYFTMLGAVITPVPQAVQTAG